MSEIDVWVKNNLEVGHLIFRNLIIMGLVIGLVIILYGIKYYRFRLYFPIKPLMLFYGTLLCVLVLGKLLSILNLILDPPFQLLFFFETLVLMIIFFIQTPIEVPNISFSPIENKYFRKGTILIGNAQHQKHVFKPVYLKLDDLKRHLIIYGQTGSGKTNFLKNILIQITRNHSQIPFLLFEFKGEFDELSELVPDISIIQPGLNFQFNLFDPDGMNPDTYAEVLFDGLKSCRIITESSEFSPQMEFVLVEILKKICWSPRLQNWSAFFQEMDKYAEENQNKIPQLQQTIIGVKNRLRRYYSGPLKTLFHDDHASNSTIIPLFAKKVILDLGSILKLGGTKEDLVFFANIILKWIWEFNMRQGATNDLRHITIFEDVSYIASKKVLESSKLSSYLEDIALLLRGKGEGLICLTTSLDISKNILLNAGSKFFFKFTEKLEESLYLLGIPSNAAINTNQLSLGFCIGKINSIPDVFLLYTTEFIYKKPRKSKNHEEEIPKLQFDLADLSGSQFQINNQVGELSPIKIDENVGESALESTGPSEKVVEIDRNSKICPEILRKELNVAGDLYLIDDYIHSFEICKKIFQMIKKEGSLIAQHHIHSKIKYLEDILLNSIPCELIFHDIPKIINTIESLFVLQEHQDQLLRLDDSGSFEKNELQINIQNKIENEYGCILFFFDDLLGPECYFDTGKLKSDLINRIGDFMNNQNGYLKLQIDHIIFHLHIFEIESDWSRSKKELLEICIYTSESYPIDEIKLKGFLNDFVITTKNQPDLFKAFYLTKDQAKSNQKKSILDQSKWIKSKLKEILEKSIESVDKIVVFPTDTNLTEKSPNLTDYTQLNILVEELLKNEHK
jgi:Ca2+/Na+ antiporter